MANSIDEANLSGVLKWLVTSMPAVREITNVTIQGMRSVSENANKHNYRRILELLYILW